MIDTQSIRPGTVNVLIGPNGSGKSRLLRKLCTSFLRRGDDVIAIAPTIYDRFRKMPKRGLRFFGARQGRNAAIYVVRSALGRASAENPQILKNLTRALEYTNFDPVVGIGLSKTSFEIDTSLGGEKMTEEMEQLHSAYLKWQSKADRFGVVRLRLDSFSVEELDALNVGFLARHEKLLQKTKLAARVEYFFYRNGEPIPLLEACSGELCFVTAVAFISTQIERQSVIAIDEPETSLHPTWQQSYV